MIRINSIRIATLSFAAMSAMTVAAAFFPAGSAMAAGPALSNGEPTVAQICTGTGENHKCLYCVHFDGGKDCFWVKVPEKPKEDVRPASDDLAAATDDTEAKDQFYRSKPHVN